MKDEREKNEIMKVLHGIVRTELIALGLEHLQGPVHPFDDAAEGLLVNKTAAGWRHSTSHVKLTSRIVPRLFFMFIVFLLWKVL